MSANDLPSLAWSSYVYNRATCSPTQLAHLPNAAAYERRYREIFMRGSMPLDTESEPPKWNVDCLIPGFLKAGR